MMMLLALSLAICKNSDILIQSFNSYKCTVQLAVDVVSTVIIQPSLNFTTDLYMYRFTDETSGDLESKALTAEKCNSIFNKTYNMIAFFMEKTFAIEFNKFKPDPETLCHYMIEFSEICFYYLPPPIYIVNLKEALSVKSPFLNEIITVFLRSLMYDKNGQIYPEIVVKVYIRAIFNRFKRFEKYDFTGFLENVELRFVCSSFVPSKKLIRKVIEDIETRSRFLILHYDPLLGLQRLVNLCVEIADAEPLTSVFMDLKIEITEKINQLCCILGDIDDVGTYKVLTLNKTRFSRVDICTTNISNHLAFVFCEKMQNLLFENTTGNYSMYQDLNHLVNDYNDHMKDFMKKIYSEIICRYGVTGHGKHSEQIFFLESGNSFIDFAQILAQKTKDDAFEIEDFTSQYKNFAINEDFGSVTQEFMTQFYSKDPIRSYDNDKRKIIVKMSDEYTEEQQSDKHKNIGRVVENGQANISSPENLEISKEDKNLWPFNHRMTSELKKFDVKEFSDQTENQSYNTSQDFARSNLLDLSSDTCSLESSSLNTCDSPENCKCPFEKHIYYTNFQKNSNPTKQPTMQDSITLENDHFTDLRKKMNLHTFQGEILEIVASKKYKNIESEFLKGTLAFSLSNHFLLEVIPQKNEDSRQSSNFDNETFSFLDITQKFINNNFRDQEYEILRSILCIPVNEGSGAYIFSDRKEKNLVRAEACINSYTILSNLEHLKAVLCRVLISQNPTLHLFDTDDMNRKKICLGCDICKSRGQKSSFKNDHSVRVVEQKLKRSNAHSQDSSKTKESLLHALSDSCKAPDDFLCPKSYAELEILNTEGTSLRHEESKDHNISKLTFDATTPSNLLNLLEKTIKLEKYIQEMQESSTKCDKVSELDELNSKNSPNRTFLEIPRADCGLCDDKVLEELARFEELLLDAPLGRDNAGKDNKISVAREILQPDSQKSLDVEKQALPPYTKRKIEILLFIHEKEEWFNRISCELCVDGILFDFKTFQLILKNHIEYILYHGDSIFGDEETKKKYVRERTLYLKHIKRNYELYHDNTCANNRNIGQFYRIFSDYDLYSAWYDKVSAYFKLSVKKRSVCLEKETWKNILTDDLLKMHDDIRALPESASREKIDTLKNPIEKRSRMFVLESQYPLVKLRRMICYLEHFQIHIRGLDDSLFSVTNTINACISLKITDLHESTLSAALKSPKFSVKGFIKKNLNDVKKESRQNKNIGIQKDPVLNKSVSKSLDHYLEIKNRGNHNVSKISSSDYEQKSHSESFPAFFSQEASVLEPPKDMEVEFTYTKLIPNNMNHDTDNFSEHSEATANLSRSQLRSAKKKQKKMRKMLETVGDLPKNSMSYPSKAISEICNEEESKFRDSQSHAGETTESLNQDSSENCTEPFITKNTDDVIDKEARSVDSSNDASLAKTKKHPISTPKNYQSSNETSVSEKSIRNHNESRKKHQNQPQFTTLTQEKDEKNKTAGKNTENDPQKALLLVSNKNSTQVSFNHAYQLQMAGKKRLNRKSRQKVRDKNGDHLNMMTQTTLTAQKMSDKAIVNSCTDISHNCGQKTEKLSANCDLYDSKIDGTKKDHQEHFGDIFKDPDDFDGLEKCDLTSDQTGNELEVLNIVNAEGSGDILHNKTHSFKNFDKILCKKTAESPNDSCDTYFTQTCKLTASLCATKDSYLMHQKSYPTPQFQSKSTTESQRKIEEDISQSNESEPEIFLAIYRKNDDPKDDLVEIHDNKKNTVTNTKQKHTKSIVLEANSEKDHSGSCLAPEAAIIYTYSSGRNSKAVDSESKGKKQQHGAINSLPTSSNKINNSSKAHQRRSSKLPFMTATTESNIVQGGKSFVQNKPSAFLCDADRNYSNHGAQSTQDYTSLTKSNISCTDQVGDFLSIKKDDKTNKHTKNTFSSKNPQRTWSSVVKNTTDHLENSQRKSTIDESVIYNQIKSSMEIETTHDLIKNFSDHSERTFDGALSQSESQLGCIIEKSKVSDEKDPLLKEGVSFVSDNQKDDSTTLVAKIYDKNDTVSGFDVHALQEHDVGLFAPTPCDSINQTPIDNVQYESDTFDSQDSIKNANHSEKSHEPEINPRDRNSVMNAFQSHPIYDNNFSYNINESYHNSRSRQHIHPTKNHYSNQRTDRIIDFARGSYSKIKKAITNDRLPTSQYHQDRELRGVVSDDRHPFENNQKGLSDPIYTYPSESNYLSPQNYANNTYVDPEVNRHCMDQLTEDYSTTQAQKITPLHQSEKVVSNSDILQSTRHSKCHSEPDFLPVDTQYSQPRNTESDHRGHIPSDNFLKNTLPEYRASFQQSANTPSNLIPHNHLPNLPLNSKAPQASDYPNAPFVIPYTVTMQHAFQIPVNGSQMPYNPPPFNLQSLDALNGSTNSLNPYSQPQQPVYLVPFYPYAQKPLDPPIDQQVTHNNPIPHFVPQTVGALHPYSLQRPQSVNNLPVPRSVQYMSQAEHFLGPPINQSLHLYNQPTMQISTQIPCVPNIIRNTQYQGTQFFSQNQSADLYAQNQVMSSPHISYVPLERSDIQIPEAANTFMPSIDTSIPPPNIIRTSR